MLNALLPHTLHKQRTQGMSGNQIWHSRLPCSSGIDGGMRGLAMTRKFLAWQMMRFNKAIRAARQSLLM